MSFSFLFFLFFFLTRIVAGQWWPQPRRRPLTRTQALTAPTPSPAQPTGPVASTSDTCSRRRPDPAATATTRTVAAPTAAAGPTPARKYSDKFFLFFPSHLNLTGQWRPHHCRHLHLPHPHVGNPAHVPILPKPQPAAATTSSPPQPWPLQPPLPHLSSPQPPPPLPTVTAPTATATPIPSPPPHQLPPCPLYHLALPPAAPPLLH